MRYLNIKTSVATYEVCGDTTIGDKTIQIEFNNSVQTEIVKDVLVDPELTMHITSSGDVCVLMKLENVEYIGSEGSDYLWRKAQ